ncbi:metallophosphoesterase [Nanoarchaeota archaeon]
MKFLIIGDFHGKLPKGLKSFVKKEKIDLVISLGDYFPFSARNLFFKYCYKKDIELWEIIGKKKVKEYILKDLKEGEKILKVLNELPVPVFTTIGNIDYHRVNDSIDKVEHKWKWEAQDFFSSMIKKYKNIKRIDYSYAKFKNFVFIGAYGCSFPGYVKSKAYKKHRKKLDDLFKRFKKENKAREIIFVSHNVPYNTKLDKISQKVENPMIKHYGSKLVRRIIDRYQPFLFFGGHMHENPGKIKLGKTTVINPGAVVENKMVIVDIKEGKMKGVKFIR